MLLLLNRQLLIDDHALSLAGNPDRTSNPDIFNLDIKLMNLCKHFIIANSSFSWWAAYLGSTENSLIFAPKEWLSTPLDTTDLIPDKWRQISMD